MDGHILGIWVFLRIYLCACYFCFLPIFLFFTHLLPSPFHRLLYCFFFICLQPSYLFFLFSSYILFLLIFLPHFQPVLYPSLLIFLVLFHLFFLPSILSVFPFSSNSIFLNHLHIYFPRVLFSLFFVQW